MFGALPAVLKTSLSKTSDLFKKAKQEGGDAKTEKGKKEADVEKGPFGLSRFRYYRLGN